MIKENLPQSIRSVSIGLAFIASYCLLFAIPLALVGLFSSPILLYAAFVHVSVGVISVLLRTHIMHGSMRAAHLIAVLLSLGTFGLLYMAWNLLAAGEPIVAVSFPIMIMAILLAMMFALFSTSAQDFLAASSRERGTAGQ